MACYTPYNWVVIHPLYYIPLTTIWSLFSLPNWVRVTFVDICRNTSNCIPLVFEVILAQRPTHSRAPARRIETLWNAEVVIPHLGFFAEIMVFTGGKSREKNPRKGSKKKLEVQGVGKWLKQWSKPIVIFQVTVHSTGKTQVFQPQVIKSPRKLPTSWILLKKFLRKPPHFLAPEWHFPSTCWQQSLVLVLLPNGKWPLSRWFFEQQYAQREGWTLLPETLPTWLFAGVSR